MSTQRFLLGDLSRKGKRSNQNSAARWDIAMHLGIHAEQPRIFHALTMPEYREVWMIPSLESRCLVAARQHGGDYSLEFTEGAAPKVSIQGSWIACRPEKLAFSWSVEGRATCFMTTVNMQIQAAAGGSILHLYHRGFGAAAESVWHGQLWQASLQRLVRMVEQPAPPNGGGALRIQGVSRLHRNRAAEVASYSTLPMYTPNGPNWTELGEAGSAAPGVLSRVVKCVP